MLVGRRTKGREKKGRKSWKGYSLDEDEVHWIDCLFWEEELMMKKKTNERDVVVVEQQSQQQPPKKKKTTTQKKKQTNAFPSVALVAVDAADLLVDYYSYS